MVRSEADGLARMVAGREEMVSTPTAFTITP